MAEQLLIDRNGLVSAITAFLAGNDPRTLDGIRQALAREIDLAGPSALAVPRSGGAMPMARMASTPSRPAIKAERRLSNFNGSSLRFRPFHRLLIVDQSNLYWE